jgi:hypothetical protein
MPDRPFIPEAMPKTVGDLRGFTVEIRCRRCGRVAPIAPEKLTAAGGRAIARSLPLPQLLARLRCTAKACGERPIQLHVSARLPAQVGTPGPLHRWVMDTHGRWTPLGTAEGEA